MVLLMASFLESVDVAIIKMEDAVVKVAEATHEIRKWRHPADGELAGLQHLLEAKIRRLQELKQFHLEAKND